MGMPNVNPYKYDRPGQQLLKTPAGTAVMRSRLCSRPGRRSGTPNMPIIQQQLKRSDKPWRSCRPRPPRLRVGATVVNSTSSSRWRHLPPGPETSLQIHGDGQLGAGRRQLRPLTPTPAWMTVPAGRGTPDLAHRKKIYTEAATIITTTCRGSASGRRTRSSPSARSCRVQATELRHPQHVERDEWTVAG